MKKDPIKVLKSRESSPYKVIKNPFQSHREPPSKKAHNRTVEKILEKTLGNKSPSDA